MLPSSQQGLWETDTLPVCFLFVLFTRIEAGTPYVPDRWFCSILLISRKSPGRHSPKLLGSIPPADLLFRRICYEGFHQEITFTIGFPFLKRFQTSCPPAWDHSYFWPSYNVYLVAPPLPSCFLSTIKYSTANSTTVLLICTVRVRMFGKCLPEYLCGICLA